MGYIKINTEILHSDSFKTNTSKLVWFCLMRDVCDDSIVHTSALSIANEIGVNEKTVRNVLKSFSEHGIIEEQSPIFSPKKVRYMGRVVKLNGLDSCSSSKKAQVRKKSDIQSDITRFKKTSKFTPPTDEEVATYVAEKGYHFDPAAFVPFYKSKDWRIGNQPMKDWRAACRTWELRWKEKHGERFYYEIQSTITTDNAATRKDSRDRLRSLATGVVSQSTNKLLDLYNDRRRNPNDSRH